MTKNHHRSPVKNTRNILSAVSLFSGCGGFCDGVETAGFRVKCSIELDKFAAETYRFNFPRTPLIEDDVCGFLRKDAREQIAKYQLGGVDLVFGGPPCQGYSQIGTRDLNDERNSLYKQFARVVAVLRPRMFLMENVPNLLLMNKGQYRDEIIREFARVGYSNATFVKVSAADYGVPQARHRVVFVGTRDEDEFPFDLRSFFVTATEQASVSRHFTVDEAISDLPKKVVESGADLPYPETKRLSEFQRMMRLDFSRAPYTKPVKKARGIGSLPLRLYNHHTKEIQARRAHLISHLKQGAKADSLPKEIWNGARPEKWRRLHPDEPSYTILAQMHRDLSEWVHPHLERWITVREAARLQSFHDGFIFRGSEWQQLKQIGNAVPPLLAYALALGVREVVTLGERRSRRGKRTEMVQQLLPGLVPA